MLLTEFIKEMRRCKVLLEKKRFYYEGGEGLCHVIGRVNREIKEKFVIEFHPRNLVNGRFKDGVEVAAYWLGNQFWEESFQVRENFLAMFEAVAISEKWYEEFKNEVS